MEDIVAARVRDNSGNWYGFMTWGRIVDRIDESWVEQIVSTLMRPSSILRMPEYHSANHTRLGDKNGSNEVEGGNPEVYFLGQDFGAQGPS